MKQYLISGITHNAVSAQQQLFVNNNNCGNYTYKNRVINFFSNFDQESCNRVIEQLLMWEEQDNELLYNHSQLANQVTDPTTLLQPIILNINSYGGSVNELLGMVDMLKTLKAPIITRAFGKICSCGFILFCIGDERYIGPNCSLMYHSLMSVNNGTPNSVENRTSYNKIVQKRLDKLATEKTGLTMKLLKEWRDSNLDKWLTPKEAIDLKIATDYLY